MRVEMVMPQMGESIAEATILKWKRGVGDIVKKDETILEISTDKVDSEIPAPAAGKIVELNAKEGQVVAVKSIIAVIETDASAAAIPSPSKPTHSPEPQTARVVVASVSAPAAAETQSDEGDRFFSPLVRSLAEEYRLSRSELDSIKGTGAQGRVTKADLMAYVESRGGASHSGTHSDTRSEAIVTTATPIPSVPSSVPAPLEMLNFGVDGITVQPFDNMRKRIAEHMVRSKATSPHVYSVAEVDVTEIAKWREKMGKAFLAREGFKLSFTPFFLEAIVRALQQFPQVNASVDGDNLLLKRFINLGCAVALGNTGLIVPVIKSADQLSLVGLARALNDLANRARSKKLAPEDIQGGTFTVTNPGVFGNIIGYPIINQPQLGIVGIGAIKKRPMVVNEMIAIRDMVYLTLSYDHRVIDGSLGGQFLQYIAKYLENWDSKRELF